MSNLMNKRRLDSNSEQTLIPILPDHLIIHHILPRLPVKSLIRFKIVSKSWLSIISSIDFAKSHLKFSSLFPNFVVRHNNKLFVPSDNNNYNVSELVKLELELDGDVILVGCCNGLLCLYFNLEDAEYFCVWNPVTQQCRKIMMPDDAVVPSGFGFSYGSSVDDYKIVSSFYNVDECYYIVSYFSLRSSQWKQITGFNNALVFSIGFECSNTLFCPDKNLKCWKKDKYIGGFDLVHEKWIQIPGVDWLAPYNKVDFFTWKDGVSLFCRGDHGSDVWVLKGYGDQNSWEKLFSVNAGEIGICYMTEACTYLIERRSREFMVVDLDEDAPDESGVIECCFLK